MMKKLLLFLLSLLMIGGVCSELRADTSITVDTSNPLTDVSQISTDKYYVLHNDGRNAYMCVNPSTGQVQLRSALPTTDEGLLPFIVRFVVNTNAKSEGDAYQLKFYDGTYLPWQSQSGANYVSATMGYNGSSNEAYLPVYNTSYFYFQVYKGGTSRENFFNGNGLTDGVGGFTFWTNGTGDNSQYQLYEATCDGFQEIDYNLSFLGNTIAGSRKLLTVANSTIASPTGTAVASLFPYATANFLSIASTTASADGSAITIPVTENYPFTTTALEGGEFPANPPLYRMKGNVGNTPTYLTYNSSGTCIEYYSSGEIGTNDYFCFTGDATTGFRIYNIGAGASVNVGSDSPAQGTAPGVTSSDHIWRVHKNDNKFGLQQKKTGATNLSNAYLCNVSSTFTYWINASAESDGGARMDIEPVTFDVTYHVILEATGADVESAVENKTTGGDMTLALPASISKPFCTYTYYTDRACTSAVTEADFLNGVNEVYALCTGPFPYAADAASITKWYKLRMHSSYDNYYMYNNSDAIAFGTTFSLTDDYLWGFIGDPYNGVKLYNKGAAKALDNSEPCGLVAEGSAAVFDYKESSAGREAEAYFCLYDPSTEYHFLNYQGGAIQRWWDNDQGSTFMIDEPSSITYNVLLEANASVKATATEVQNVGKPLAVPSSASIAFCTYTYYSDAACTSPITTVPAGGSTVYALCTAPFKSATSAANISQWYKVRMHSNQTNYMYNNDGAVTFNGTYSATDNYLWGFVGNPYDGYQVYNKGAGTSVALDDANPCTLSASGTSVHFMLAAVDNIGSNVGTADSYFCLYENGTTGQYLNYRAVGNIQRWTGRDEGSTFMINEVSLVTYNVILAANGATKTSASTIQDVGATLSLPSSITNVYCTYTYYSDVACTSEITTVPSGGTSTVYALCSWNGPFEPSTELAPVWYLWKTAVGANPGYMKIDESGAPACPNGVATFTGPVPATHLWQFIGNPVEGFNLKNLSTGTFLGGRTTSGGYLSMETPATCAFVVTQNSGDADGIIRWYDETHNFYIDRSSSKAYAHTAGNKNQVVRVYKVHFNVGSSGATLVVGSTTIADPSEDIYLTTDATLTTTRTDLCTIAAYDGYATLAEALTNDADGVINLTFNYDGSLITDLANLSNSKAYVISNARASWTVAAADAEHMTTKEGTSAYDKDAASDQFALIQHNGSYYIYSVNHAAYLRVDNTFGNPQAVSITATGNGSYPWQFHFTGNAYGYINVNNGDGKPLIIDNYTVLDDGNRNAIIEAADFDPTDALAYFADGATVTVVDGGNTNTPYDTYGTRDNSSTPNVFTSNVASGVAGLTIVAPVMDRGTYWSTKCLTLKPSAKQTDETITITAPSGYKLDRITMTVQALSSYYPYKVTLGGDTQNSITGASDYTFTYNNVDKNKATITFQCTAASVGDWLAVKYLVIDLLPMSMSGVTDLAATTEKKAYAITNTRGWWAVGSGATVVTSTASAAGGLNLATDLSDTKQQFAIIPFGSDYYLYSVSEQKYVYWQKDKYGTASKRLDLSTAPVASPLTLQASTHTDTKDAYPSVITVNGRTFGVSTGYNPHIYNYQSTNDEGNGSLLVEAANFDPATALSRLPITDLADLSNGKQYAITCPRGVLTASGGYLCSTACTGTAYTEGTFAIITKNGKYYLWSVDGAGWVSDDGSIVSGDAVAPVEILFVSRGDGKYSIKFADDSYINTTGWDATYGVKVNFDGAAGDDGNCYYICPVADNANTAALAYWPSVTYTLRYGGANINVSEPVEQMVGEEVALPAYQDNGLMTYVYKSGLPETAITNIALSTTNIFVDATWAGPFDFYADYASIENWYWLKMKGSRYVYNSGSGDDVSIGYTSPLATNGLMWAFVGDPYSGFTIYNKAKGSGYRMTSDNPADESPANGGADTHPTLTSTADDTPYTKLWKPYKSDYQTGGFYLLNQDLLALNNRGSNTTVDFWTGGMDNGSTFQVELVPTNFASRIVAEYGEWFTANDPTKYFNLKSSFFTTVPGLPACGSTLTWQEIYDAISVTCSAAQCNEFENSSFLNAPSNFNLPATGYYRIKSSGARGRESYIGYGAPTTSSYGTGLITVPVAKKYTDASTVMYLEQHTTPARHFHYLITTENLHVQDQATYDRSFPATDADQVYFNFTPTAPGVVIINLVGNSNSDSYFHESSVVTAATDNAAVVRWYADASASKWTVEDATTIGITLNNGTDLNGGQHSYATTCLPFDVTLPGGVKAYTMTKTTSTNAGGDQFIKPTELGSQELPAGTAVLLMGAKDAGTVTATISGSGSSAVIASSLSNALRGTYTDIAGAENTYLVLGQASGVVGFFKLKASKKIPANRAYFLIDEDFPDLLSGSVNGYSIGWDFDWEDGVEDLQMVDGKWLNGECIYDLQGRKVSDSLSSSHSLKKGIYVVNGKKVMIK